MQLVSESSVLSSAQFIYKNAKNVWIDPDKVESIAKTIIKASKNGKIPAWTDHILNPREKTEETLNW